MKNEIRRGVGRGGFVGLWHIIFSEWSEKWNPWGFRGSVTNYFFKVKQKTKSAGGRGSDEFWKIFLMKSARGSRCGVTGYGSKLELSRSLKNTPVNDVTALITQIISKTEVILFCGFMRCYSVVTLFIDKVAPWMWGFSSALVWVKVLRWDPFRS